MIGGHDVVSAGGLEAGTVLARYWHGAGMMLISGSAGWHWDLLERSVKLVWI
jgi:hypothetical protein